METEQAEIELQREVMRYEHDPLGFILAAYPWGEGPLTGETGPRAWQRDAADEIGRRLRAGLEPGAALMPVLKAISSGHGIGKSAFLSWMANWSLATCPHSKVVVAANTEQQLRTKTWPEITKWTQLMACAHWFTIQGTSILAKSPSAAKTWRIDAVTWTENNTQAFAGLHNKGRRLVMLFDEASGIGDKVWDVASGALTDEDTEILWLAFGQMAEPQGMFFECFHRNRHLWHPSSIDSRTVEGTNRQHLDEMVRLYGEDHDYVRVRVRGLPPRAGSMQFIGPGLIEAAAAREAISTMADPLVFGVDVARFGDDQSVLLMRKGRDQRSWPLIKMRGVDTMQFAGVIAEHYHRLRPDGIFVDDGGVGGGVVDRLRQLNVPVIGVHFGGKADRVAVSEQRFHYRNKRAEMWGNMREWLEGGAISDDPDLRADLAGPQYSYVVHEGRDVIALERKEDMKARGFASPDVADALALTFAYPVFPASLGGGGPHHERAQRAETDVFAGF